MSWERYNRIINALGKTGVSWQDAAKSLGLKDADKLVAQGRIPVESGAGKRDNPSGTDLARYEASRFMEEIIERAGSKGSREDAEVLAALQFQLGRASGLVEASAIEKLIEVTKELSETLKEHNEVIREGNEVAEEGNKATAKLNETLARQIAQTDELAELRRRRSG